MGTGRKVDRLTPDQRAALDAEIVRRGFGDFFALEQWTRDQGFPLSHSTLHRHAKTLRAGIHCARELFPIGNRLPNSPDMHVALLELGTITAKLKVLSDRHAELLAYVLKASVSKGNGERLS